MTHEPLALVRSAMAACASLFDVQAAEAKSPPSVDAVLREQAKLPPCSQQPVIAAIDPEKREEARKAGFAFATDFCLPTYSKTLVKAMRDHRLSAACGTLYDVDRAGVGIKVETRCSFAGNKLDDDWRQFFETAVIEAVARAASARLKFEPAVEDAAATREGFVGFNLNAGGVDLPPMDRFKRAGAP